MFRKTKKDHLGLNVKVSYDKGADSISITSVNKLPKQGERFNLTLEKGIGAEQTLRAMLEKAGIIPDGKILPAMLPYDDIAGSAWDEFPLGSTGGSNIAFWKPMESPNLLITGQTGSGKSVIERNLIFHCLQHPDKWRIYGIDLGRVDLRPYAKYSPVFELIATNMEDALEMCRAVISEMMERFEKMEKLRVAHYRNLPEPPPAIMFLVEEIIYVLTVSGVKTGKAATEDALREEMAMLLTRISRVGRAAGIHLVLSTQRPNKRILHGEFKANMTTKIVAGRADISHSHVALGNDEATRTPIGIKGRGYIQERGQGKQFQSAFAPLDWYDEWLKKNPTADSDVDTDYVKEN